MAEAEELASVEKSMFPKEGLTAVTVALGEI